MFLLELFAQHTCDAVAFNLTVSPMVDVDLHPVGLLKFLEKGPQLKPRPRRPGIFQEGGNGTESNCSTSTVVNGRDRRFRRRTTPRTWTGLGPLASCGLLVGEQAPRVGQASRCPRPPTRPKSFPTSGPRMPTISWEWNSQTHACLKVVPHAIPGPQARWVTPWSLEMLYTVSPCWTTWTSGKSKFSSSRTPVRTRSADRSEGTEGQRQRHGLLG